MITQIPHAGPTGKKTILLDLLILTAIWAVSLVVVNPRGDFPINDDWAFGSVVRGLVEHGEFHPTGWASMPLLTNVLWGSLFCLPAGFSFNALRVSTLVLGLAGMLGAYWLAREFRLPRWVAWFSTLSLGFNPIYYALSYSFMTDVPFTAFSIFSVIFFFRNLKNRSDMDWAIGLAIAVAATLSRQLALAIPFGFGVALVLREGVSWRIVLRAAGPVLICGASLMIYQHWLISSGQLPTLYNFKTDQLIQVLSHPELMFRVLRLTLYSCLLTLGLFLSPVLICLCYGFWAASKRQVTFALLFALAVYLFLVFGCLQENYNLLMPAAGNIINQTGIGPQMLRDFSILHLDHVPSLPRGFWLGVTVISVFGLLVSMAIIGLAVVHLAGQMRPGKMDVTDAGVLFLLLSSVIYLIPLLVGGFFDRYLIVVLPWVTTAIASFARLNFSTVRPRLACGVAVVVIGLTTLFAVGGTRDFMAWNRLRWQALNDLVNTQHIQPEEIDGGFEFGGMHFYNPQYRSPSGKSYWWVHDDLYQIGFGPVPGTSVIKEYKYYNWLPPHPAHICVLKRNAQVTAPAGGN